MVLITSFLLCHVLIVVIIASILIYHTLKDLYLQVEKRGEKYIYIFTLTPVINFIFLIFIFLFIAEHLNNKRKLK